MEQYSPLALANSFIEQYGQDENSDLTHMKLQKLTFYSYGWWLTGHDTPLLKSGPEVWKYGPVFSDLYNIFRFEGSSPIKETFSEKPFSEAPLIKNEEVKRFIQWIWKRYGKLNAIQLSELTHAQGTPWQIEAERHNYCLPQHHRIPDDLLKKYFQSGKEKLLP